MSSWGVPGFTAERELGTGASGRVVAAAGVAGGARVAIKYLAPRLLAAPGFVEAFRAEAALLRALDVPQVVRLLDYVEAPGQGAAIVMELVEGVTLREMLTRQGPAGPQAALAVLKGSLLGLAAVHALGIVHRDYKPENVLVDSRGASKLTDFGLAARTGDAVRFGGTPLYMAPEQWNGSAASPASDIYAATVVFFECLTGRAPYSGQLGQLAARHEHAPIPVDFIAGPLRPLIARGMAKDPAARPANAAELVAELEATATAAYGTGWEAVGRAQLAARAAALLLLVQASAAATAGSGSGTSTATTWFSLVKGSVAAHALLYTGIAAAVIGIAGGSLAAVSTQAGQHPGSAVTSRAPVSSAPASSAGAVGSTAPAAAAPTHEVAGSGSAGSATPGPRQSATSAVTGTPSPVPGAPRTAPATGAPAIGPCPAPGLRMTVGTGQGAAGSVYFPLEFTNTSGRTCTLYGYPGVAYTASTAPGSQVGAAADRETGRPATVVTLAPDATASAVLRMVNVDAYPASSCGPVSVSYLQVYPPGQTSAAYLPYTWYTGKGCSRPVFQLGISTVAAGVSLTI
jgi:eukaryotic-like serine/threonine-protein kinase